MGQTEEDIITQFWRELKEYLLPDFAPVRPNYPHKDDKVKFKKENTSIYVTRYDIHVNNNGLQIVWCLDSKEHPPVDHEWRKIFYENLLKHREKINQDFGGENSLCWDHPEKEELSELYKVCAPFRHCDRYNEAEWESIFESIKDSLERLDEVMFPSLEKIENEMPD